MSLHFDETSHTYTVDGKVVPGVTTILSPLNDHLDRIPPAVLENAANFGRAVHRACELDDNGMLDEATLDPALEPYLAGWRRAKEELAIEVILNEIPLHSKLGYAGTPDRYALVQGKKSLLDLKTSRSVYPSAGPQTAAYARLVEEATGEKAQRRYVVHLTGTGYALVPFTEREDWSVFLACLSIHNWRTRHG